MAAAAPQSGATGSIGITGPSDDDQEEDVDEAESKPTETIQTDRHKPQNNLFQLLQKHMPLIAPAPHTNDWHNDYGHKIFFVIKRIVSLQERSISIAKNICCLCSLGERDSKRTEWMQNRQ
jgi:hypothetical protein